MKKKHLFIIVPVIVFVLLATSALSWYKKIDDAGIYIKEGHISKKDANLSEKALQNAVKKFQSVHDSYIKDSDAKVYYALIPDKNYYLAQGDKNYTYDYNELYSYMEQNLPNMTYIEIKDLLSQDDYYFTDTHWRQEKILDVAQRLASSMGVTLEAQYEEKTLDTPFEGVYFKYLGFITGADTIQYLDHEMFSSCTIINHEKQKEMDMYDMQLASEDNPYEMFLSGTLPVITIENPNATTDKELVIFRDSFGSSLAPLLVEGYSKITLLDIRYMHESLIPNFVEFTNQDVLFIYNTTVINNRTSF